MTAHTMPAQRITARSLALATSAALSILTADAAEAGGIRLGFGGPLGTFVATPAHSGSGPECRGKRGRGYTQERLADRRGTKRGEPKSIVVATTEAKPQSKKPAEAKLVDTKTADAANKAETKVASLEASARASATTVMDRHDADKQAGTTTATTTSETKPAETVKVETQLPATAVAAVTAQSTEKDATCRRFIPAIGVTISVRCGE